MELFLVYNWKTYVTSKQDAVALAAALHPAPSAVTVACPSSVHITAVREVLEQKRIIPGAQDISVSPEHPQTGRLSGAQLRDAGVRYVIVGHAETRARGVTNAMVADKAAHALKSGITPIICLSEQEHTEDEVVIQLKDILGRVPAAGTVIAYEPAAHIGADTALDPPRIKEVTDRLRLLTTAPILYGGSIDAGNADAIMHGGGVNGFLLGRASTDADTANTIAALL